MPLIDSDFKPDTVLSAWDAGEVNQDLPSDLKDFFTTFDTNPEFMVTVQAFNNEAYTGRPKIIGEYRGELPNYERLVKMNGAVWYRYKINYILDGIDKKKNVDVDLTSKNWQLLARAGDTERRTQKTDEIKEEIREANLYNTMGSGAPQQTAKEAMKETIDTMLPFIELMKGGSNNDSGMGSEKMMLMMMQMQQNSTNMMMNMFGMMNKSQSDMMIAMNGNGNNGSDMLNQVMGLTKQVIGMKDLLSPKEETLIDKIGNFIGNNIDVLGDLMSKSPEDRENDSGYKKMQKDKRFKKIQEKMNSNENFAKSLIKHLDGKVGSDTTDKILEGFVKYKRKEPVEQAEEVEATTVDKDEITDEDFE